VEPFRRWACGGVRPLLPRPRAQGPEGIGAEIIAPGVRPDQVRPRAPTAAGSVGNANPPPSHQPAPAGRIIEAGPQGLAQALRMLVDPGGGLRLRGAMPAGTGTRPGEQLP
jgi:hypothetical protein